MSFIIISLTFRQKKCTKTITKGSKAKNSNMTHGKGYPFSAAATKSIIYRTVRIGIYNDICMVT